MALFGRGGSSGGGGRERTAADREAARLERERRRAQRAGRSAPWTPGDAVAPVEPVSPVETPQPVEPAAHAQPYEPQPEPYEPQPEPLEPPAAEQPPASDEHLEPEPPEPSEPEQAEPPAPEHEPHEPLAGDWHQAPGHDNVTTSGNGHRRTVEDQPTVAFTLEEEHAATTPPSVAPQQPVAHAAAAAGDPTRRTIRLPRDEPEPARAQGRVEDSDAPIGTRRGGRPPNYSPQPGAPGPGHRQITVRRPRRRSRLIAALVALLVVIGAVVTFAWMLFQPFHGEGSGSVRVVIKPGMTASQIGDELAHAGVVDSGFFFDLRARLSGHRGDLRAGTFTLRRGMPYSAAIAALTTAPKAAPVINVTLPEGPSRGELAPLVRQAGVKGNYLKASASAPGFNPRKYGAPKSVKSLEGFLFPSTYELRRSGATAKALVADQLAAFKQNISKVDFSYAKKKNLTVYDVLIIASMIEREARIPRERPLIAAVIYNRLKQNIRLGIDATIRYYEQNWSRPLRVSELERHEPYNTRKNFGLPPTPIGNPGLASIEAAAHPAKVGYLYYVVKPCGNGAHTFSSTSAQFDQDVAAYNRKRDELGGKDPSTCKK